MRDRRARQRLLKPPKKTMTAADRNKKSRDNQQPANPQPPISSSSAAAAPAPSAPSTADVTPVPGNHTTLHGTHPHRPAVTRSAPQPNANASAAQPTVRRADAVATASRLASDVPTPAVGVALPAATSRVRIDVRHEGGARDPSHSPLRQTNLVHEAGVRDPSHSPIRPTNLAHGETSAGVDAAPASPPAAGPTADDDDALPTFRGIRNHRSLPPYAASILLLISAARDFIDKLEPCNGPVTTAIVDIARELYQESTVPVDLSRFQQAIANQMPGFTSKHVDPRRFLQKLRLLIDDELLEADYEEPLPTEAFDLAVELDRTCRCGTQRYAHFVARPASSSPCSHGAWLLSWFPEGCRSAKTFCRTMPVRDATMTPSGTFSKAKPFVARNVDATTSWVNSRLSMRTYSIDADFQRRQRLVSSKCLIPLPDPGLCF
jgi:hypothetical protein